MRGRSLARRPLAPQPDMAAALPAPILERLAAEGITTLSDWRKLKGRRLQIFGVTRRMAAQIDALAQGRA